MRRVVTNTFGSLDDLHEIEEPDLVPEPGQVVIDVEAAGVNFVDALLVQGRYQITPPLPYTPGSEVAGTVTAVGDGVDGINAGQRVLVVLPISGGYATQVAVAAPAVVAIPDNLSPGQAAGLVQSYATMLYGLTRRTTVNEGEWFAVLGAGGGIGLAAVDLASTLGAKVVACASTDAKLALAKSVGAIETITYEDVDLKTAVREVTGGGADCVVDPVGGDKAEPALRSLRFGGRYLVVGFAAGQIPRIPLNQVLLNSRSVIGIEWGAWVMRDPSGNRALLGELMQMVADGRVHPVEPSVRPLSEAAAVLVEIQSRQITGKVVLTPDSGS